MKRKGRNISSEDSIALDAMTQEDMENQAIAASMRLAYEQIMNGTASQQVIVHFLKAGSSKQRMEIEKLRDEKALLQAKVKNLESQERSEQMFNEAITAFSSYSGHPVEEDVDNDE